MTATQLDPCTREALEAANAAEEANRQTRLGPAKLQKLRRDGLVYVVAFDGRRHVHLTRQGRQALGLDVGIRP